MCQQFSIMDEVVDPPYSQWDSGLFGIIMIVSGLFGGAVFGTIVDKFRNYKM
jgi:hypothetical protein